MTRMTPIDPNAVLVAYRAEIMTPEERLAMCLREAVQILMDVAPHDERTQRLFRVLDAGGFDQPLR